MRMRKSAANRANQLSRADVRAWWSALVCFWILGCVSAFGQIRGGSQGPAYLDPAPHPEEPHLPESKHLREQFIWTKGDAAALNPAYQSTVRGQDDKIAPHYFRAHFTVSELPKE